MEAAGPMEEVGLWEAVAVAVAVAASWAAAAAAPVGAAVVSGQQTSE